MFDVQLRRSIDPLLNRIASLFVKAGVRANIVTLSGALVGVVAALAIANNLVPVGLALILLNRFMDGLDGAIARASAPSQWGGYLDNLADYAFYVAIPLGFAGADPGNVWPALFLVSSFTLTAVSFLALAAILAGRDMGHGEKAFTYSTGLMEGGETIAFFGIMCILPGQFPLLASVFAILCLVTVGQRLWLARRLLS
jgi:phosphatidylglycerophosphate synthase